MSFSFSSFSANSKVPSRSFVNLDNTAKKELAPGQVKTAEQVSGSMKQNTILIGPVFSLAGVVVVVEKAALTIMDKTLF